MSTKRSATAPSARAGRVKPVGSLLQMLSAAYGPIGEYSYQRQTASGSWGGAVKSLASPAMIKAAPPLTPHRSAHRSANQRPVSAQAERNGVNTKRRDNNFVDRGAVGAPNRGTFFSRPWHAGGPRPPD